MRKKIFLGAITACVSGVAHTYMAAKALEQMAKKNGYDIHIETQGALGVENTLDPENIKDMDCIIIAVDIALEDEERFAQKRCIYINTRSILLDTSGLEMTIKRILITANGTKMDLRK